MADAAPPTVAMRSPTTARVRENRRLTPPGRAQVHHVVLGFEAAPFPYEEGQSIGIVLPDDARTVRYYAIASDRSGDDGRGDSLSLCVKRSETTGGGSDFLCGAGVGDAVPVLGPFAPTFPLPRDPSAGLLMVATGTGVASFRGLARRLLGRGRPARGLIRLDHGVRHRDEAVYADEFAELAGRGLVLRHAFSGEGGPGPRRVDESVEADGDPLWDMLRSGGSLYICGVRGMEHRVEEVFARRARRDGLAWEQVRGDWIRRGRLRVSTS